MARHRRPSDNPIRRAARDRRDAAIHRVLLPTVSALTVGAVTVGGAFAVTGTNQQATSTNTSQGLAAGADFSAADAPAPVAFLPSSAEAAAIDEAVRTSPYTAGVASTDYQVTGTRLAGSDPTWAWTELLPVAADLDRAEAMLHKVDGRWELVQLGSFEVGCDVAPRHVMEDLELYCQAWDVPTYRA